MAPGAERADPAALPAILQGALHREEPCHGRHQSVVTGALPRLVGPSRGQGDPPGTRARTNRRLLSNQNAAVVGEGNAISGR